MNLRSGMAKKAAAGLAPGAAMQRISSRNRREPTTAGSGIAYPRTNPPSIGITAPVT